MIAFHRIFAGAVLVLGLAAFAAGDPARGGGRVNIDALAQDVASERDHVSAITLAEWIRDRRPDLRLIDLRDSAAFESLHIPTAQRKDIDAAASIDAPVDAPIVIYSEGGTHAAQLWFMLRARGYRKVYFLREGLYEWVSRVLNPMLPVDATPAEREEYARASEISRYFGGMPKRDVPRTEIPDGYWLYEKDHGAEPGARNADHGPHAATNTDAAIENVRRRGC
jgi:rhodanese-related sulfurtransferase